MAVLTQWRPVVGYEGLYEVSDQGEVRSIDRYVVGRDGCLVLRLGKLLKPGLTVPMGYPRVYLSKRNQKRSVKVHVLVAEAFIGPRPSGYVCCHNDGDASNNRVSNLRWDTRSSNNLDTIRHGRHEGLNRTHCANGHEFTPENTYRKGPRAKRAGSRRCRKCVAAYDARKYAAHRAAKQQAGAAQ